MRFTLKQLKYVDAALRTGSIARAAVEMNISQSSITSAIDLIEQTTGAELLRRMPAKGVVPTDKGLEVGKRVQEFLEQARIFESDLLTLTGDPAGTLRLACYAPTAPYVLPPILKRISEQYPQIRIELKEGDMHSITELLNSGAVDLALTYRRETPDTQPFERMFRATPIALIPDVSPLARQRDVDLSELVEMPMILARPARDTCLFHRAVSGKGAARPDRPHHQKARPCCAAGGGRISAMRLMNLCGPNDREGRTDMSPVPIRGQHDSPQYGVAYTNASQRSALVRTVLETCKEIAANGGFDHLLFNSETCRRARSIYSAKKCIFHPVKDCFCGMDLRLAFPQ